MEGPLPPSPDLESTGAESGAMNSIRVTITSTTELLLTIREEDAVKGPFSLLQPSPLQALVSMASRIPVLNPKHFKNESIEKVISLFIFSTLQYCWQSSSLLIPFSSAAVSKMILG